MKERFEGESGLRLRIEALKSQKLVAGNANLAIEAADLIEVISLNSGEVLIEQGGVDNEIYLIFMGRFSVVVNGKVIAERLPNEHVGEMAAIEPSHRRAASIVATEDCIVAKLAEKQFTDLASRYPEIYLYIARELAKRLLQRNLLVKSSNKKVRVFVICSVEALPIARAIETNFMHDNFLVVPWSNGVFKVTNYTLQDLEDEVFQADFAVAIAHGDDKISSRNESWPSPRDNVIFELGLCMGRLGRNRAILMEPGNEKVKLPSDLAGITTIRYKYDVANPQASMSAACNLLRNHISKHGLNN